MLTSSGSATPPGARHWHVRFTGTSSLQTTRRPQPLLSLSALSIAAVAETVAIAIAYTDLRMPADASVESVDAA
jgi:hypothetical protein